MPGVILALGCFPLTLVLVDAVGWSSRHELAFIVSAGLLGWTMSILDLQVYMLFEGRRYWPGWLRRYFVNSEYKRLGRILNTIESNPSSSRPAREASVELRKFPLLVGAATVEHPTRLGNLIISYERYPETRYGLDTPFFWYRLWFTLTKDTKDDIENQQAIADSAVYASFACGCSGLLWFVYSVLTFIPGVNVQYLPGLRVSVVITLLFCLLFYLLYRVGVQAHVQYGEVFKSLFDIYEKQIDVTRAIDIVSRLLHDSSIKNLDRRAQRDIAWRYLHNYRIKCSREGCADARSMSPQDLLRHNSEVHKIVEPALAQLPPAPDREYYLTLGKASVNDRKRRYIKGVSTVFALGILSFALYRGIPLLFVVEIVVGLFLWAWESKIKNQQRPFLEKLTEKEDANNDLGQIYRRSRYAVWRQWTVMFPHVGYVLITILLLVWRAF